MRECTRRYRPEIAERHQQNRDDVEGIAADSASVAKSGTSVMPNRLIGTGQRDAHDALRAVGDRQRQGQQARHLGQDERHHCEVDAAQPQDRQADQDARRGAEQPGQRQGQPERHAVRASTRIGRDIASKQRIGALADIDAADVKGEPDTAARDGEQGHRCQRVVEIERCGRRDQPSARPPGRTRRKATSRDEILSVPCHAHHPHGLPISPFGRMLRKTINGAKMTR